MDDEQPCRGLRKDGSPCRARPLPDRHYCWAHDDDLSGKRQQARKTGGHNKATEKRLNKALPPSLKPILELLMSSVAEVHAGTLDPRQASGMASLASAIGRLYETAALEERLEALEKNGRFGDAS
jgi:hypothetical protein